MFVGREESLARRWQARMEDAARPERRNFLRSFSVEPGPSTTVLGTMIDPRGRATWIGLPTDRLMGYHAAIAGGTGTGKTSWLLGVLGQIAREDRFSVIVYDAKGETVDLILDLLVPFLLENGAPESLLDRLRVLRVFDQEYVPLLNLTLPETGVPAEAQAYGVASAVEQALSEPLGGRMHHVLVRCVALCIERSLPITRVLQWLQEPKAFLLAAEESADESVREYARFGFRQENRESLRALGARLNALLFWPGARRALCAPGSISFAEALDAPGISLISTGSAPAGSERLARFFGAALLGKIVRAILSRNVTAASPPAIFIAEEIQECLGAEEARQLGRLLATARYKRAAVWLTGQSRSQLNAVDPGLVAAIRANVGIQTQFRTSPEDAAAFAYLLPEHDGGEAARRELINSLTRLPQRHCYLAIRDNSLKAQLVLAPRIDFDALRTCRDRLGPEAHERIRRGIATIPIKDAEQVAQRRPVTAGVEGRQKEAPASEPGDDRFPGLG